MTALPRSSRGSESWTHLNIRKNWQKYYESALEELDRVKTEENVFLPKALYSAGSKSWPAIQTITTNETK